MNMNANELLKIEISKPAIENIAATVHEAIESGMYNPLEIAIKFKALEEVCKLVKEKSMNNIIDELYKHPKQTADLHGCKVSIMEAIKYDYSHLTEWADLEKQRESICTMQKVLEDTEKKWRRAELPVKSATTTYKIILNK
jgi:hypothetical protein